MFLPCWVEFIKFIININLYRKNYFVSLLYINRKGGSKKILLFKKLNIISYCSKVTPCCGFEGLGINSPLLRSTVPTP